MEMKGIAFYVFLVVIHTSYCQENINKMAAHLTTHLKANYSRTALPKRNYDPVSVQYGIEIIQITLFNERTESMTLKTWTRQRWMNELLSWKPEEWEGVEHLVFDQTDIWVPDILLYNNAGDRPSYAGNIYRNPVHLSHNGLCVWLNPVTFKVICQVDIAFFPFDKQDCYLKFGSWSYHMGQMNLTTDPSLVFTEQFQNSSEWTIIANNVTRNEIMYGCCVEKYVDITFHITLLRNPMYYTFNVIIPCLVLVSIILCGFYLPVESGERISLTITILLAIALFLQLINDALPKHSHTLPVLAVFYMAVMVESALSLLVTCVVLSIHYKRHDKKIPQWLRYFFIEKLAPFFGMPQEKKLHNSINASYPSNNGSFHNNGFRGNISDGFQDDLINNNSNGEQKQSLALTECQPSRVESKLNETLDKIYRETKSITSIIEENEEKSARQDEWKFLAEVVDRFFYYVFIFGILVTTVCILLPASLNYYKYAVDYQS